MGLSWHLVIHPHLLVTTWFVIETGLHTSSDTWHMEGKISYFLSAFQFSCNTYHNPIATFRLTNISIHHLYCNTTIYYLLQVLVEAVDDIERCTHLCLEPLVPEDLDKLVSPIHVHYIHGLIVHN